MPVLVERNRPVAEPIADIIPPNRMRLADEILDRQIVDVEGAKLERVNDIHFLEVKGLLRLAHVDVSFRGLVRRMGWGWWTALAVSGLFVLVTAAATVWLFISGVGIWGINTTVVWGFAIANYVWWIGIGNAGTLISSMLLLTRQRWRALNTLCAP